MHTLGRNIRNLAIAASLAACAFGVHAQTITAPFSLNLHCQNAFPTSVCDSVYTVPASNHLEVKNVSVECDAPLGSTFLSLSVESVVGGVPAIFTPALPATKLSMPTAAYASMRFTQLAEVYADPGSEMTLIAYLNEAAPTQQLSCVVNLQGLRTAPIGALVNPLP